jgi:hypothetical protein
LALPRGHREKILADLGRERLLYGAVLLGVVLELGLGLFIWNELRDLGAAPERSSLAWLGGLGALALAHLAAARWVSGRLGRPGPLMERVRSTLEEAGLPGAEPSPEVLTVVAIRAAFVSDVVAWILIQFVTVYGLVAVVMTGSLAALLGFVALSVLGLVVAAPRPGKAVGLAEALHGLAARKG